MNNMNLLSNSTRGKKENKADISEEKAAVELKSDAVQNTDLKPTLTLTDNSSLKTDIKDEIKKKNDLDEIKKHIIHLLAYQIIFK